jgi:hypothetical protein
MNTYQEEKHASSKLVVKVARENPQSTALIPSFEAGITKLDAINIEVEKIRKLQDQDISGVTVNKNFTEENLNTYTVDVAGAVYSYAVSKKDEVLKGIVNYKRGTVGNMTAEELISAAGIVLEEAKKVPAADLAKEGITADELKTFEDMVTYFKTVSNSPRESIIDRSGNTKRLAELFKESASLYKNTLDRLGHQFLRKDSTFYYKYRGARKVIHHGGDNPDTTGTTGTTTKPQ